MNLAEIKAAVNSMNRKQRMVALCAFAFFTLFMMSMALDPVFAAGYKETIKDVLEKIIGLIGTIFSAVGIVFTAYGIGQLAMAFKNEDADSKSRATTMIVVGVILIAMPTIIDQFKLVDMITKS